MNRSGETSFSLPRFTANALHCVRPLCASVFIRLMPSIRSAYASPVLEPSSSYPPLTGIPRTRRSTGRA
jgi:hypothetical protein